ncbi:MAG: MATE family efflux transporter [Solirubrobacterales bacterium]
MSNIGNDLTTGSVPKQLVRFAIPTFIGYFLYTGYSIINTIWVGNLLGETAVGATAVSFVITYIIVAVAFGATMASTILVAQNFGAKNIAMVEKVVGASYSLGFIINTVLTLLVFVFSDSILTAMNTPQIVFESASTYLKISILGCWVLYYFILNIAILRGIGDTVTPMALMSLSVVINAVLDPVMIMGLGPMPKLGLNGAAYASLIAQTVALITGVIYVRSKNSLVAPSFKKFNLDKNLTTQLLKVGFPAILQQSLTAIGGSFMASFVNYFGAVAIAGYGAVIRVDSFINIIAMSLGTAAAAFTGQNLGAKKPERVREAYKWGIILSLLLSVVITLICVLIPDIILSAFVHQRDVLNIGSVCLQYLGVGYVFMLIMFSVNGLFNGSGKTMVSMIITLTSLWIIRIPISYVLMRSSMKIEGIWLAIDISYVIAAFAGIVYFYQNNIKKPKDTAKLNETS